MLHYKIIKDTKTSQEWIETSLRGKNLLTASLLNKGTAFSQKERLQLQLLGKLPFRIETIEEQLVRVYKQYEKIHGDLERHLFLSVLHSENEVLFYRLISDNLQEMMPIIYTPTVGMAVKRHSHEYVRSKGLYISYPDLENIDNILENRTHSNVELIVVTDGQRVLGIGDQGIGGINISIAKLMVYTICGGINPYHCLPIVLDVGTDNEVLLNDPLYLGWRNKRIVGKEYDKFIECFINAVKQKLPKVFLHWEDFGRGNARRLLDRYRDKLCSFNDDMQGTAIVTLSAVLAAVKRKGQALSEQRVIIFGAGTAGTGIADQMVFAMQHDGISLEEAQSKFWLIDKDGLVLNSQDITDFQLPYARDPSEIENWQTNEEMTVLEEIIENVRPTVLIGCSAVSCAFNESVVKRMYKHVHVPIIFPLSNPNQKVEATPQDLLTWTNGQALVATGSPFPAVEYSGKRYSIAQCNNALAFPGIGLGVNAVKAKYVSDEMLWVACQALSDFPGDDEQAPLLPGLNHAKLAAKKIAVAIIKQARKEQLATHADDLTPEEAINMIGWFPNYLEIKPIVD